MGILQFEVVFTTHVPGFCPSTFLQPVHGSKISCIEFWNTISSSLFKYFFVCLSRKNLDRFSSVLHCFYSCIASNIYKTNKLNWLIRNSTKKSLQLHSKNQKQTWWWCRCFFCFCVSLIVQWRDWLCYLVTKTKTLGIKKCNS